MSPEKVQTQVSQAAPKCPPKVSAYIAVTLRLRGLGGSRSALIPGIHSPTVHYSRAEIEMRQPNSALTKKLGPKRPQKFTLLQEFSFAAWAYAPQAYQLQ